MQNGDDFLRAFGFGGVGIGGFDERRILRSILKRVGFDGVWVGVFVR
jgi:hypothetical protein